MKERERDKDGNTEKFVYNDQPRDPKIVAIVIVVQRSFTQRNLQSGSQNSGRCRQVVAILRWSLTQVWLYIKFKVSISEIPWVLFSNLMYTMLGMSWGVIIRDFYTRDVRRKQKKRFYSTRYDDVPQIDSLGELLLNEQHGFFILKTFPIAVQLISPHFFKRQTKNKRQLGRIH